MACNSYCCLEKRRVQVQGGLRKLVCVRTAFTLFTWNAMSECVCQLCVKVELFWYISGHTGQVNTEDRRPLCSVAAHSLSHTHRHTAVVINCSDYGGSRCIHGGSGAAPYLLDRTVAMKKKSIRGTNAVCFTRNQGRRRHLQATWTHTVTPVSDSSLIISFYLHLCWRIL